MNSLQFFIENKNDYDYPDLRNILYKKYIKSVEENMINKDKSMDVYRIILSNTNNFPKEHMNVECNGLILEHNKVENEYKVLNVPLFSSITMYDILNKNIQNYTDVSIDDINDGNDYKVYRLYDGTIINLYYYNDKWCLSTGKGYEVNDLLFADSTYQKVFESLTSTYYPEFSYDKLDKSRCYSICMKYHKYHAFIVPYSEEKLDSIRLIQSVDLTLLNNKNELSISMNDPIGFDFQEEITVSNSEIFHNDNYLCELFSYSKNEYNIYKNKIKTDQLIGYNPIFGYVIRNNNLSKCGLYSNIIIESSLYVNIKNILYKNHELTECELRQNHDIVLLNIIKTFLGYRYKDSLYKLFPVYHMVYKTLHESIYDQIPSFIIGNLDNLNLLNSSSKKKIKYNTRFIHVSNKSLFIDLAIKMFLTIKKNSIVLSNDRQSKSIVIDFIHDKRFLVDYYTYIETIFNPQSSIL